MRKPTILLILISNSLSFALAAVTIASGSDHASYSTGDDPFTALDPLKLDSSDDISMDRSSSPVLLRRRMTPENRTEVAFGSFAPPEDPLLAPYRTLRPSSAPPRLISREEASDRRSATSDPRDQRSETGDLLGGQFSRIEVSVEAAISGVESRSCVRETRIFLHGLRNLTLWATQMFDASVKYPLGLLSGNVYNMGDFDECLSVKGAHDIRGRYCLAKVDLKKLRSSKEERKTYNPFSIWLDPMASAWEQIEYKGDRSKHRKDAVYWAVCVPSACTAADLEIAMNRLLPPIAADDGIGLEVSVPRHYCSSREARGLAVADWAFCAVVLMIAATALAATIYDSYCRNEIRPNSALGALFLCFSTRRNFKRLPKMESNDDGLKIMSGIRVISMIMIIMCHKYGVTIGGATTNGQYIEEGNRKTPYMLTLHGDLVVDTFFAVGAFLLAYSGLKDSEHKKKSTNVAVMYFLRYVRLTPAYALIIFFYATVLKRLGSGPLWNATVAQESSFCTANWWINLLYLSNYVNTEEMCMVQSWYLPCDMHYFTIGVLLVALLRRKPAAGHVVMATLVAASVAVPLAVTLAGRHDATLLFYRDFLSNPRASRYFQAMYIRTHTRAGPYAAGFLAGYLFYKYRLHEKKISKAVAYGALLLSAIISAAVLFSAVVFYTPSIPYRAWDAAAYAGLQRFAWGISVSLFVISVASGHIRSISAILCWTPFVALGKLTYCAYLIHFIYQLIALGGDRNANYVTNYNVFLKSAGESVFTFAMALVLYLAVEAPFKDLGRILIGVRRQQPRTIRQGPPEGAE